MELPSRSNILQVVGAERKVGSEFWFPGHKWALVWPSAGSTQGHLWLFLPLIKQSFSFQYQGQLLPHSGLGTLDQGGARAQDQSRRSPGEADFLFLVCGGIDGVDGSWNLLVPKDHRIVASNLRKVTS